MNITDKKLVKTLNHSIPSEDMWKIWTTSEGLARLFDSKNKIELTPFGAFEIYFIEDNPPGLKGSETCQILSFLPEKMLSFTWNAPPQFESVRNSKYKTWVVLNFEPNKVTLTHLGWPDDKEWEPVYEYFENAWDMVLGSLKDLDI